ncbi:S-layer homology domain-containing protein [Arthrobacter agilis]|uniref:S-layer homology domain-containing protein n=1 Tax=Arthrobacter agilis TaxID=37921 RepID=UPI0027D7E20B|nr:S-layer homology domain-containing protein [Arthrobacter agilis]
MIGPVTPTAVVFTDKDGIKDDTYTIPTTTGVEYQVAGKVVAAGTYPGTGTLTVTARATTGYVLAPNAVTEWTTTFKTTPLQVTPTAVVFTDKDGTKDDTYTIPTTTGVEYQVAGKVVAAGTYPGTGTLTVTARATTGYVLAPNAVTEWTTTFKTTAAISDTSGPALVSSSVTPTELNLESGPRTAKITAQLRDQTGVRPPTITVSHTTTDQSFGFGAMSLVSGTTQDGTWERTVTIPEGSAPGKWEVTLYPLTDTLGNTSIFFQTLATLTVTGAISDTSGPALVSSSVTPTELNLESGPRTAKITAQLRDQTGVRPPTITVSHTTTDQSFGFGAMSLVSGTTQDGTWERTVTIPEGSAPGKWEVTLYPLTDTLGNTSIFFQTLATLTVTGAISDTSGPALVSSSVTPTELNLESGPRTAKITAQLRDQTGVRPPTITVSHTTTDQSFGFGAMSLVSGTTQDGTWERTVTIPEGSAPGKWEVTLYPLTDTLGNTSIFFQTLATLTVTARATPTPLQVTPTAVVFTDKDGIKDDTYTIPTTTGVEYQVAGKVVAAGTYPGTGTLTVTARATTGYVLAPNAVTEWTTTFKTTPLQVTPTAVVFTDKDGIKDDTYTIPTTTGVEYQVAGKVVAAGTYPGTGTLTVTARATTGYVLAPNAVTEWTTTFKTTPLQVTPTAVVFTDKDGIKDDTYTIPTTTGVEYQVAGKVVAAGTYPGTGTLTVTARATTGYVLAPNAVTEWTTTFKTTPLQVTPTAVVFTDKDGIKDDTYTIPTTTGVEYQVAGKVVAAGTYPGTGTLTVTARATTGYVLAPNAVTEWTTTFNNAGAPYAPPAVSPFADVSTNQLFYKEMSWLAGQGISTGWAEGNGTRTYRALQPVNRDAMAAFLYRAAGSPTYTPPTVSPFADVATNQQFYKEMSWLAGQGISTGWAEGNGTRTYRALQPVNRDAMAAFLYRAAGSPTYTPPTVSPFADVATNQQFYKEMSWLAGQGISTGWAEGNGTRTYRALQPVNRDAMAAFLYRANGKP